MAFLDDLPAWLALVVVAALVATEGAVLAGLVLPSATALVALGLLANEQVVGIVPAALVAVAAALLGGNGGYFAGRRRGPRSRWVKERHWRRAERIFERYGGRSVFFGQWVAGARTIVPRLAGMNGVAYRRFVAFHTPAAAGWSLWLVLGSYLAGASYDVLAARAGRAGGALAVLTALLVVLVLAGRWLGAHPMRLPDWPVSADNRVARVLTSLGALVLFAMLLVFAMPLIVKLSGLAAADDAVSTWARGQWTSDGYRFAFDLATSINPEVLLGVAAVVVLGRAWWRRAGLLDGLALLMPLAVLSVVLFILDPPSWEPGGDAAPTAQLAAVVGLVAWLVSRRLPWPHRVTTGTVAAAVVVCCAGSWVYLGWSNLSETIAAVLLGGAWVVLNAAIWASRTPERAHVLV